MKVKHSIGVSQWSGKAGNDVFMPSTKEGMSYRRVFVTPTATSQNAKAGATMKNLADVWSTVSSSYKDELHQYGVQYSALPLYGSTWKERTKSNFAIWVKMLYMFSELDPGHVDLETITYADLQTVGGDIDSVFLAIQNGYLPEVPNPGDWTSVM